MLRPVVDHLLERRRVQRRQRRQLRDEPRRLRVEILQRPDAVRPAPGQRLFRLQMTPRDQQLQRPTAAHNPRHEPGRPAVHPDRPLHPVVAHLDVVRAEPQIAGRGDLPAMTQRPARHQRHHRLAQRPQAQQKRMMHRHAAVNRIDRLHPVQIIPRAKRLLARPAQRHHPHIRTPRREIDQPLQLVQQPKAQRIQPLRTIQRDRQHPLRRDLPQRHLPLPVRQRTRLLRPVVLRYVMRSGHQSSSPISAQTSSKSIVKPGNSGSADNADGRSSRSTSRPGR